MSEQELQRLILDWLNRQPECFAWRIPNQGTYDQKREVWRKKVGFDLKGVCDTEFIYPEGCGFMEVKKPGSTITSVSESQIAFINKINKIYGRTIATWVDSLEKAQKFYQEVRYG